MTPLLLIVGYLTVGLLAARPMLLWLERYDDNPTRNLSDAADDPPTLAMVVLIWPMFAAAALVVAAFIALGWLASRVGRR